MKYIIVDLDNCISDDEWRLEHIDHNEKEPFIKYHAYHSLAGFDKLRNNLLFKTNKCEVVILTSRPMMYAHVTMEWLKRNNIKPHAVLMRPSGDLSSSVDLKRKQLSLLVHSHRIKQSEIKCAYDDRIDVIDMYKAEGLAAQRMSIYPTGDENE